MSEEKGKGLFGGLKDIALSAGLIEEGKSETAETAPSASSASAPSVVSTTPSPTAATNVNTELVEQLRKIAFATANSPLTNSFMKDLNKAAQIESDPVKVTKMALMFSEIPAKDLVKEIESAIAANLSGHKHSFAAEVNSKRSAIDEDFSTRQQALETAVAEDQRVAAEIQQRLVKNTTDLANLASKKQAEVAIVDKKESEALASLSVVEGEINTLLKNLKAA